MFSSTSASAKKLQEDGSFGGRMDDEVMSLADTTVDGGAANKEGTPADISEELGVKQDDRRVQQSKACVYLVIALAAIAVAVGTYMLMEKEEEHFYYDEFEEFAEEIVETSAVNYHKADLALSGLAVDITSHALSSVNESIPFLTLPSFGVRSERVLELAAMEMVAYAPLVPMADKEDWETYAVKHQGWIQEDLENGGHDNFQPGSIRSDIFSASDSVEEPFLESFPIWQMSPVPTNATNSPVMLDVFQVDWIRETIAKVIETRHLQVTTVHDVEFLTKYGKPHGEGAESDSEDQESHSDSEDSGKGRNLQGSEPSDSSEDSDTREASNSIEEKDEAHKDEPRSLFIEPVFESFSEDAEILGVVIAVIPWKEQFSGLLEGDEAKGMIIDLENSCDTAAYAFYIHEKGTDYIGMNVQHPEEYSKHVIRGEYFWDENAPADSSDDRRHLRSLSESDSLDEDYSPVRSGCVFTTAIYFSEEYVENWQRSTPVTYTVAVVSIFVFTLLVFVMYDFLVQYRQTKVMKTAKKSNQIVSTLFPKEIRDQLMAEAEEGGKKRESNSKMLKDFFEGQVPENTKGKPIADVFPRTTIMFADMVGFTSWSSARQPEHVFQLLETIYSSFDAISERRSVYKVETVGDCYVAISGLPIPNKNHAVVMARFARDCMVKFNHLVKGLETTLGPDTGDLQLRTGLHSGPVTAGVIRGQRARFQIFGDSVNTCSRIETTGAPSKIHLSQETADLIKASGREHWLVPREEKVKAKGKGELSTFWLEIKGDEARTTTTLESSEGESDLSSFSDRTERLIDWSTETLGRLLLQVQKARGTDKADTLVQDQVVKLEQDYQSHQGDYYSELGNVMRLAASASKVQPKNTEMMELSSQVMLQLRQYVTAVSNRYHDHPFHNYDHACNVTNAAVGFMSKVGSSWSGEDNSQKSNSSGAILRDPLLQFTFALSCLIHDIDHTGAPNSQLIREKSPLADQYSKSQAEQNSISIAWAMLMEDKYKDLRHAIYSTPAELGRFRGLLVRCVLSTDIMDKNLTAERKARWAQVFESGINSSQEDDSGGSKSESSLKGEDLAKHKATILVEHLMQASDVSHTMQHWLTFRKWNENLFMEMYKAFLDGRAEKDPSEFWYQGELGFFDYYVIPLATKLFHCGVLEVSDDELVSYARSNRTEWQMKGRSLVEEWKNKAQTECFSRSGKKNSTQAQTLYPVSVEDDSMDEYIDV